jgi:hypothetical protein
MLHPCSPQGRSCLGTSSANYSIDAGADPSGLFSDCESDNSGGTGELVASSSNTLRFLLLLLLLLLANKNTATPPPS